MEVVGNHRLIPCGRPLTPTSKLLASSDDRGESILVHLRCTELQPQHAAETPATVSEQWEALRLSWRLRFLLGVTPSLRFCERHCAACSFWCSASRYGRCRTAMVIDERTDATAADTRCRLYCVAALAVHALSWGIDTRPSACSLAHTRYTPLDCAQQARCKRSVVGSDTSRC
jgi:hypothetical protein